MTAKYAFNMPFTEAIDYIRQKIPVVSNSWADFTGEMHSRAFVVAGANRQEIVADFYEAITKAIEEGKTITWFRKEFDKIVEAHGWSYNGKRGWRTKVIYETNLAYAYAAGREKQRSEPEILKAFPYDRYCTERDERVRKQHQAWEGVTLPADDTWWHTHTPPLGWGCRCWKEPIPAPDTPALPQPDTMVDWENPSTGKVEKVIEGISPGFGYNPAASAWGINAAKQRMDKRFSQRKTNIPAIKSRDYTNSQTWQTLGLSKDIPLDDVTKSRFRYTASKEIAMDQFDTVVGENNVYPKDPLGETTLLNKLLIDHWAGISKSGKDKIGSDLRNMYLPFLVQTIENPAEIWVSFSRDKTGKVSMTKTYIKRIKYRGKEVDLVFVAESQNGWWVNLTFYNKRNIGDARFGKLVYTRKKGDNK